MATSGNFVTSSAGRPAPYFSQMIFEWWETGRGISGSVGYHNIAYHVKSYGGSSGYWQNANGSMNVDGSGYTFGRQAVYGGGATVFGDYGKTLYTDSVGNRSFGASAQFAIYLTSINSSGSGSWGLDNIPLHAVLSGLSMDAGGIPFTDEGPAWLEFNNPSGTSVDAFIDSAIGRAVTVTGVGSRYNFDFTGGLPDAIQLGSVNSNTYSINIGIIDHLGGGDTYDYRNRSGIIANNLGQANPIFSNYTFADVNSTTTTLTGNNQYLIQGQSSLRVTIIAANKATPVKHANMSYYSVNIGEYSNSVGYSGSSTVALDVGPITDATGLQNISTAAVDSRGNTALVTKPVTILPYAVPVVNATATRANGYDDALVLDISGTVSPVTISSVDKNQVNSATGVQYRFIADGGDITAVSWLDVANTQTAGTGEVNGNSTVIIAAAGDSSAAHSFAIEVRIIDGLYTTTQALNIPAGVPIFRIGTDRLVYNNEKQLLVAPTISVLADDMAASAVNGTGTITPWTVNSLYVSEGTGIGNSSTVVFDIAFSFWANATTGLRTWALKIDGNAVGDSARKFFVNAVNTHIPISSTVVATGLSAGTHTVTVELYGGGNDVRTDTSDFLTIVSTEYANAYVTSSSGPFYAGTVADGGGGGNAWTDVTFAQGVENATVAYVAEGPGGGGGSANQLVSSGHGFAIPGGAIINGIVVEALVFGYNGANDAFIEVGKPGKMSTATPVGYGQFWFGPGSLNWLTWGSASDLWGRSDWTAADINNSGFGASLSAYATHSTSSDQVDAIRITVYYI